MGDKKTVYVGSKPVERTGLYIMVFLILLNTCDLDTGQKKVMNRLKKVEKQIELIQQPIEETNEHFKGDIQKSGGK